MREGNKKAFMKNPIKPMSGEIIEKNIAKISGKGQRNHFFTYFKKVNERDGKKW